MLTTRTECESDIELALKCLLEAAGMSLADYRAMSRDPALKAAMVEVLQQHRLFATPEEQVESLLEINERVWKNPLITPEAIRKAGDPPACPVSNSEGLFSVSLLVAAETVRETFDLGWSALEFIHGRIQVSRTRNLERDRAGITVRPGARRRRVGIGWAVNELGRMWHRRTIAEVQECLDEGHLVGVGAELPLIAAQHPRWARSLNGTTLPHLAAPDLLVTGATQGQQEVLGLRFNRGANQVRLHGCESNLVHSDIGIALFQKFSLVA